ncbi:DUF3558 domain-containing protein [Mycolicibacterium insubricum]|uniref:DUF3558 domain-containing protein n=1 Tax=Mycolicibacterium insubricum TaxID=444597 RepID=UPI0021F2AA90|nr:DUF3558 domain-containing protein [Mycolicibacterium insubricum]MCV7080455.1 DUF3558 domain-containing protein [Mycolicibacterium insubricum]
MVARLRLWAALTAVVAAAVLTAGTGGSRDGVSAAAFGNVERTWAAPIELRNTDVPLSTTRRPVLNLTDPDPFDPCRDIPLDVTDSIGLGFTPPEPQNGLRCQYDAGNYQMAVEAFVWRTYEQTLPKDGVETTINGHRAATYWVMKPTDWNNRWWFSCMIAYKTSYGVIQQSLFYSPIHSPDAPECMTENMMRAQQLSPYYKF